jgi:hypothetical protein
MRNDNWMEIVRQSYCPLYIPKDDHCKVALDKQITCDLCYKQFTEQRGGCDGEEQGGISLL